MEGQNAEAEGASLSAGAVSQVFFFPMMVVKKTITDQFMFPTLEL